MIFGKWKDPGQRLTPQETCFPSKRIQQIESTARPLLGLSFKFFCRSKSIRLGSIPYVDNPLHFRLCSSFPGYRDHSGAKSQKDSTIRLDFRPHRSNNPLIGRGREFILHEAKEPVTTISASRGFFPLPSTTSGCTRPSHRSTAFVYCSPNHPGPQEREFWVVDIDMLNSHPSIYG